MILKYLENTERPWAAKIGLIIPRVACTRSTGDASLIAGGAHCAHLMFWFQIVWPDKVHQGTQLKRAAPGYVHINALEFIVILLQMAAIIVRLDTLDPSEEARFFPTGKPILPVADIDSDNTTANGWATKLTTKSYQGQGLLTVFSEMLREHELGLNNHHLAGELNVLADFISRPTNPTAPLSHRALQIIQQQPSIRTWHYFQPNPMLVQLLYSRLFTPHSAEPPRLPRPLGRFVPTESIISNGLPTWDGTIP